MSRGSGAAAEGSGDLEISSATREDRGAEHSDEERYPECTDMEEQRRAFVLNAIGSAASEMDAQTLCQMVLDTAEMLRTGTPPAGRKLRPVR